jgi:DNA-binding response OmpR family regulator
MSAEFVMNTENIKTVLVIEDDADIQNFISRVLELEGYHVLQAGDGNKGMERLKDNSVGLILLDLMLPGIDGWTLLQQIKHNKELSGIPVVIITAVAESVQKKRALRMGAAEYLTKPLSAQLLMKTVNEVLGKK